jgi:hypothetical protein
MVLSCTILNHKEKLMEDSIPSLHSEQGDSTWKPLYRAGALAALLAALVFRRNIGAEVSLFTGVEAIPAAAADWFVLLQEKPFIGLSLLAAFDLVNYILVGVLFLALTAALWQANRSAGAAALASGLTGIAINLASNNSLTMLSLSQSYAAAVSETQKAWLLSAGQAVLGGSDPLAALPATGTVVSLLLVALAGLLFSFVMLPSHRKTTVVGILASSCDLAYCLVFPLTPIAPVYLLLAAAGLFWMVWHLLAARYLWKQFKE